MHRIPVLSVLIVVLLQVSCSQRPYNVIDINTPLRGPVHVAGEELNEVLGEESVPVMQLEKAATVYIGFHLPQADTLLFDIRDGSGQILKQFARMGNGPAEYLAPFLRNVKEEGGVLTFDLLDVERCRLDSYKYEIADNQLAMVKSQKLPQETIPIGQLLQTERGFLGILDNTGSDMFTLDADMENFQKHPYVDFQKMTASEGQLFHTASCVSPDGKHVALAFLNLPRIDIVDSSGHTEHTCYYGRRIAAADAKSDERYFGYIRSDNDYLYVKYLAEHGRNLILKISWNGEIAGVYDLDRDLVSFSIIDGSLYGMSMSPITRGVAYVRYVL